MEKAGVPGQNSPDVCLLLGCQLFVESCWVGNVDLDHDFWGRPEDMRMARPAYKVTTNHPGSDLAGETAAALAAGYLAFKDTDAAYASELLTAARSLYNMAYSHHGLYHHAIPEAADAYPSYGFQDELCWGAAWLYKATGEATYLSKAEHALSAAGVDSNEFSWDDKSIACVVLLHEVSPTARDDYADFIKSFLHKWRRGTGGIHITPCGLSFLSKWGSLRYALNAALIALMAAEQGIEPQANREWALSQLNYALGDNKYGRSYVVGSCPSPPASCDWSDYEKHGPNAHVLYGALVGGPDNHDNYHDNRTDYVMNEVTCDYNAGFQCPQSQLSRKSPSVAAGVPTAADKSPAEPHDGDDDDYDCNPTRQW
nr:hypothetical protein BaRGS_004637 [Batillaria attramentaria]